MRTFLDGRVTLHLGDCLDVLASLPEASVDSVVCDPPYHLTSIQKRYSTTDINGEGTNETRARNRSDALGRLAGGFMGKLWDGGDIAARPETWAAVLRVLKPGGHLLAFSGTRTYHRMVCAIEDAGFEIRDQIGWAYGSGFPKSHDVSKGIDIGRREWSAWLSGQRSGSQGIRLNPTKAAIRIRQMGAAQMWNAPSPPPPPKPPSNGKAGARP